MSPSPSVYLFVQSVASPRSPARVHRPTAWPPPKGSTSPGLHVAWKMPNYYRGREEICTIVGSKRRSFWQSVQLYSIDKRRFNRKKKRNKCRQPLKYRQLWRIKRTSEVLRSITKSIGVSVFTARQHSEGKVKRNGRADSNPPIMCLGCGLGRVWSLWQRWCH